MPVTTSSALIALLPSRQAAVRSPEASCCMKTGTNAAVIAPSANRSRTTFGIRKATLKASMALPAPNIDASTWSRTRPRMRLVIVAAPADAAERASRLCWEGELGSKLAADRFVDRAAVRILAGQTRHHRLHDLAHVFDRRRTGLGDGVGDGGLDVRCRSRGRKVLL